MEEEHFKITVTRMNGVPLAKMKVTSEQTVADLAEAIKTAAQAPDLNLLLAFESEVLGFEEKLAEAGLYEGCSVTAIRFPELFLAATYDDGTTKIWSAESGDCERILETRAGNVTSVAFAASGLSLVMGNMDGVAQLWSIGSGQLIREYAGHSGPVVAVACAPNGRLLATGCLDRTARLWDFYSCAVLRVCTTHRGTVTSVAFSPDSRTLATGSEDHKMKLWDTDPEVKKKGERMDCGGHQGSVQAIAFSPHGKALASGSLDSDVKIWGLSSGRQEWSLQGAGCAVCALGYSPDGMSLAVGGSDGNCRIWSVGTGSNILTIHCNHGIPAKVRSVAFSPAGTRLATGSSDGGVHLWGSQTGEERYAFELHQPPGNHAPVGVFAVAFSAGPVPPTGERVKTKPRVV